MERSDPMYAEAASEFPYKHSTGTRIGRFLAGLRDQQVIWGQRAAGLGVVVPPHGYSEVDGSAVDDEWVAVGPAGTVTAVAVVHEPVDRLHPFTSPFAYVLVRLDGADTAMAHVVAEHPERVRVGSRVTAVWASERVGSMHDIRCFQLVDEVSA